MSAGWDPSALLQPIDPERPCGDDLEDTQLLASFDAFRLFGHQTPPDTQPEWGEIKDKAVEALGQSKDLRLLAHLGAALLRTDGLPAFAATVQAASQWLDAYWDETYPRVDEDAILRRNALNCFADPIAVVDGIRRVPLVESRVHGRFSIRDVDVATGLSPAGDGEAPPDEAAIAAAFAEMPLEQLTALHESVGGAIAALRRIDARMRDESGSEAAPGFDPLMNQLGRIDRTLKTHVASRTGAGDGSEVGEGAVESAAGAAAPLGAIRSRQDAIRALDAVAQYFRQQEPSSPIPLLLDRAKRLVAKDFLEVLAEMAPDALAQARAAGGLRDE